MKKIQLLVLASLLFLNLNVFAQKEITVTPVNKQMSRGMQAGYMVNIPEAKLKEVNPALKKQLEENTKANAKEINGEMVTYEAVNKNFSLKPFIIYSKLLETTDGVELTAFVTEDSLTFLDENGEADKVAALKKSLHDFAAAEYKKVVTKQLNVENGKLSDLKKTLDGQVKDENDNTKEISKKQREIESSKSKIEANKVQQASKAEQVGNQQKMVDGISDKKSPEYNLAGKNLKKYVGEGKDLEKDAEKLARSIDDNNAEIKELELKNENVKKQQADTKQKIEAQETAVKNVTDILNGIK
ncbi:MAG: hypothetical protein ABI723_15895 [Bacteroidia bacterium]